MTPTEFIAVRNGARAVAGEIVVRVLAGTLQSLLSPLPAELRSQIATSLEGRFSASREEHLKVAIQGLPAEQSDLIAGEFQDAFDALAADALKRVLS